MRKLTSIVSRLTRRPSQADIELLQKSDLMDPAWYRFNYGDIEDIKDDPIIHYLRSGATELRNPSLVFNTAFYLSTYPDVVAAKINPLVHYLRRGASEGRLASADQILLQAVEEAPLVCRKPVELRARMALVVASAPEGELAGHVVYYLEKLAAHGVSPILIVATDEPFPDEGGDIAAKVGALYVRADDGQDFAAWAHVIKLNPGLLDLEMLILANDRFLGPIDDDAFRVIIDRVQSSDEDVVGLTDGYAVDWHIEPYFLALKKKALASTAFREFMSTLGSLHDKSLVLTEHVLPLMDALTRERLTAKALFPTRAGEIVNRTVNDWRELLGQGFPFLDMAVIQKARTDPQNNDWAMVVSAHGFDPAIVDHRRREPRRKGRTSAAKIKAPTAKRISTARSLRKGETAFSPEFYLHLYPDVKEAGWDPMHHFIMYGQAERRLGSLAGAERLPELAADPMRDTVLVVSHDGSRTGCPILSFNICKELAKRHNVIALFLHDGPVISIYRAAGLIAIGPVMGHGSPDILDSVVSYIQGITPLKFAVANSVESRHILPALARLYVPTVSLIHEFSAYIPSATAFRDAIRWAGETVFSAPITRDDALRSWPALSSHDFPIVPQGRCLPLPASPLANPASTPDDTGDAQLARLRRTMRPDSFPKDGLVLIGIGTVQFRKGVDLFLDCAAKIKAAAPDTSCRFIWVGHGYHPKSDFEYSAYLLDQLQRAGLAECVEFLGETTEMLEVYALTDFLLVTSRLDPLPNVAIEAMESGVPVACFDRTTGVADVLRSDSLGDDLVADYLDVEGMAQKVAAILKAPDRLAALKDRVRQLSRRTFNMDRYVLQIEELAGKAAVRAKNEQADVGLITERREFIRFDYTLAPGRQDKRLDQLVREYVRSWASEIDMRKLAPGFHPGVYRVRHGAEVERDPLADYLARGSPEGPWSYPVITPAIRFTHAPRQLRVGLHIHAHYPNLLPELLTRLKRNRVRPDLLVSITRAEEEAQVNRLLRHYPAQVDLRVTPNRGRDIGALFTEFGHDLQTRFDVIGHLHTKKTADIKDSSVGRTWYRFLLENLVGGQAPMADIILGRMVEQPRVGLVFADDPHVVGWDANLRFIEPYLDRLSLGPPPRHMHVPVGTMFWARPEALTKMFELGLGWEDYPAEPLPFDGSLLHGLERLFGLVVENAGYSVAGVNCPGVTR